MQSKVKVFIFLIILAFPFLAISTDHQIFFGLTAAVLAISSFSDMLNILAGKGFDEHEIDEELEEELEDLADIDLKMFGTGLSVACNLIVILFMCYCFFYLESLLLKGAAAIAILLQLYFILVKTRRNSEFDKNKHKPQILLASVSNIAVILFTLLNKISRIN